MSGVTWCLVGSSVVLDKKGFVTCGGNLVYELTYHQLRDHEIFKNWAPFEWMAGEASIGKY